jgi:poly-gamma-glutamate capsule biosynthesis protein CapA/YwtB (metallophosphatase superfamily)
MHACGVSAVIGAHSHQAATRIEAVQGGEYQIAFSLGNLLFDQKGERVSGALLEVRLFKQGTFATRLIPMPNLFDRAAAHAKDDTVQSRPVEATVEDIEGIATHKRPCVGKGC